MEDGIYICASCDAGYHEQCEGKIDCRCDCEDLCDCEEV